MGKYSIGDMVATKDEIERRKNDHFNFNMKVAIPGIIINFDAEQQTVDVQPTIRERMKDPGGNLNWTNLPVLPDLPLVLPKAGNFILTMPVNKGDEVLVVFADSCIDSWWASGGIQNWNDKRRHDLSDGFAILGTWSQPNRIPNYSSNSAQLRSVDGSTCVDVQNSVININAANTVNINTANTNLGLGGNRIARLGDSVKVTVPTHGNCDGIITSAGVNRSI